MELVGYPSGQIVELSSDIFDAVKDFEEIFYDEEWTEEQPTGQYGFNDDDEDVVKSLTKFVGEDIPFNHDYLENQLSYFVIADGLIKLNLNDKWVATFEVWIDSEDGRKYIIINHTIIYLENLVELN